MKLRIVFFSLIFLFSLSSVFAKKTDTSETASQSVTFSIGRALSSGTDRNTTPISGIYTLDKNKFGILFGLQGTKSIFDFTVGGDFWPFVFHPLSNTLKFGFSGLYHYQYYSGISNEHDLLAGFAISYATTRGFYLRLNTSYMEKISTVFAVQSYVSYFNDHSFAGYLLIDKTWKSCFEFYQIIGTYDMFRYPLFCSPSFTGGIAWNTKKNIRFAFEAEIRFSDFFTTALNPDRLVLNATLRYKF